MIGVFKPTSVRIRDAAAAEGPSLEALQRRSSDVWDAYRDLLAANPDAIELPQTFIDCGWVRVAVVDGETPIGFSVVVPMDDRHELDGLFVEPAWMHRGGRALVEGAAARASATGARSLEVTAGPAQGFYDKLGFTVFAQADTRFGPALRMRRRLQSPPSVADSSPSPTRDSECTIAVPSGLDPRETRQSGAKGV